MKTIVMQVLDGNLTNEQDPTREQVDDYVDMLTAAVAAEYPGSEINIDLQRQTSGASRPTSVFDDDYMDYTDDDEYSICEIEGAVWVEWCEKHDLA